ncbi:MAG: hypothetical protein SGI97_00900 [candidate division Zixibacteria bacterium]|mgnify:CR=1 FL=1|nr:hypothetical protein [candidate division Zixibacteria bacterium]
MIPDTQLDSYDINKIIVKPLYFGLVNNILLPMVFLFICYYLNTKGTVENKVGDSANMLFYIFVALALAETGAALWLRASLFKKPMVKSLETLGDDIGDGLLRALRPVFLIIASISVYGLVYFMLTGRFNEAVMLVVFSFVVFQFVRPRFGMADKLIEQQTALAKSGQFLKG